MNQKTEVDVEKVLTDFLKPEPPLPPPKWEYTLDGKILAPIVGLADAWCLEARMSKWAIKKGIIEAAVNGEFDDLPRAESIAFVTMSGGFIVDPEGPSKHFAALIGAKTDLEVFVDLGFVYIHETAIRAFAGARGLSLPSFLPIPTVAGAVAHEDLKQFLEATADGKLTRAELEQKAREHFAPLRILDKNMRGALS